ncbi:hypothetical protein DIPPA_03238 [Diplonema papillatum]|nr:hypothetical protein DIPPA_03238 [Diplonema papillatum]|eukprot:gene8395-12934_t
MDLLDRDWRDTEDARLLRTLSGIDAYDSTYEKDRFFHPSDDYPSGPRGRISAAKRYSELELLRKENRELKEDLERLEELSPRPHRDASPLPYSADRLSSRSLQRPGKGAWGGANYSTGDAMPGLPAQLQYPRSLPASIHRPRPNAFRPLASQSSLIEPTARSSSAVLGTQSADTTLSIAGHSVRVGVAGVDFYGWKVPQLLEACASGDAGLVQSYFASPLAQSGTPLACHLFTPFHATCLGNPHPLILSLLLENTAVDINTVSAEGSTALHLLCANPNPSIECLDLLLQNGASLDIPDADGLYPLHVAAGNPNDVEHKALNFILYNPHGIPVDINQPTETGLTASQLYPPHTHPSVHNYLALGGAW